jgi:hypothetical protein
LPFTAEELAVTALVHILPRSRYRLAAQTDGRFQTFASNTTRIAYRQQGGTPAFLLFSGPGQNPNAAALAAAAWAHANWRPNAVQRKVKPGVVVVHVAPGNQLTPAGPVAGTAVPATVWTVDSATGKVEAIGRPPGSPSAAEVKTAASSLMRGVPAPPLGELDLAERGVMQMRTVGMAPALGYGLGILLFIFALRYGFGGLIGLIALPSVMSAGGPGLLSYESLGIVLSVLLLCGILFGAALLFNFRNLAYSAPGFSSPTPGVRNVAWGAYIAVMIGTAVVYDGVLPQVERQTAASTVKSDYTHVKASLSDDGGEVYVVSGGDVSIDLTGWPSSEWNGVDFKSSNPSVLTLDSAQTSRPEAKFSAHQAGVARVNATSADGKYAFQIQVDVGSS